MADSTSTIVHFAFGLDDSTLEDEDRLRFTDQLLPELRQMDEVEKANLIEEPTLDDGARDISSCWAGSLPMSALQI